MNRRTDDGTYPNVEEEKVKVEERAKASASIADCTCRWTNGFRDIMGCPEHGVVAALNDLRESPALTPDQWEEKCRVAWSERDDARREVKMLRAQMADTQPLITQSKGCDPPRGCWTNLITGESDTCRKHANSTLDFGGLRLVAFAARKVRETWDAHDSSESNVTRLALIGAMTDLRSVFDAAGRTSPRGLGLTDDQLVVALRNIGYDLTCGACAAVFYTGTGVATDQHTCSGENPGQPQRIVTQKGIVCNVSDSPIIENPCECGRESIEPGYTKCRSCAEKTLFTDGFSEVCCTRCGARRLLRRDGTPGACSLVPSGSTPGCPSPLYDVERETGEKAFPELESADALRALAVERTKERDKAREEATSSRAIAEAARRYVIASDAHEARDWDTFKVENLAAVAVEYDRLRALVLAGTSRGEPNASSDGDGSGASRVGRTSGAEKDAGSGARATGHPGVGDSSPSVSLRGGEMGSGGGVNVSSTVMALSDVPTTALVAEVSRRGAEDLITPARNEPVKPTPHRDGCEKAYSPWAFYVWADGKDKGKCIACHPRHEGGNVEGPIGATAPKPEDSSVRSLLIMLNCLYQARGENLNEHGEASMRDNHDTLRAYILKDPRHQPDRPIPMFLTCPKCNARHIDEGEFATKSHHTHSCQECGLTWRPAVVPTVGVLFLPGFKSP